MISKDDARLSLEFDNYYIIQPDFRFFARRFTNNNGNPVREDFEYNSGTNTWWLTVEELNGIVKTL